MKLTVLILSFIGICLGTGGWVVVDSGRRGPKSLPVSGGLATTVPVPSHALPLEEDGGLYRMDRELIAREWPLWLDADTPDRIGSPAGTAGEASVLTNFVISAIWLQGGHRLAVVNGRVVQEGHRLPPFRIRRIQPGLVTFSGPTGDISIRMRPDRRSVARAKSPPGKAPGPAARSGRASGQ